MTSNVVALQDYKPKPERTIRLVGGERVPISRVTYIGRVETKDDNPWEVVYRDTDGILVTLITSAVSATLLLVKIGREHGVNIQSNIA